jgi:hypothetical protein
MPAAMCSSYAPPIQNASIDRTPPPLGLTMDAPPIQNASMERTPLPPGPALPAPPTQNASIDRWPAMLLTPDRYR